MSNYIVNSLCSKANILPNGGLINHAKSWFNFDGNPNFSLRISDQVKWQLYHAANSIHLSKNQVKVHQDFGSGHLSPEDTARLYRIINSFHKTLGYEKKNQAQLFLQAKLINIMVH